MCVFLCDKSHGGLYLSVTSCAVCVTGVGVPSHASRSVPHLRTTLVAGGAA